MVQCLRQKIRCLHRVRQIARQTNQRCFHRKANHRRLCCSQWQMAHLVKDRRHRQLGCYSASACIGSTVNAQRVFDATRGSRPKNNTHGDLSCNHYINTAAYPHGPKLIHTGYMRLVPASCEDFGQPGMACNKMKQVKQ